MDGETLRIGRDRISRVFRYLEALNQHRNPAKRQIREQLWVLWFRDLPNHPSIRRGFVSPSPEAKPEPAVIARESSEEDFVLKVRRPTLTRAPSPPEVIAPWFEHGWDDPFAEVRVHESLNEAGNEGETRIVRFEDNPERPVALQSWKTHRDEWARNEKLARDAMKIFEQLYMLHGWMEREAERVELVLADGILSWRRPEGGIYHPVLLQRLQLEFEPSIPEFTVFETDHAVELYSALFRSMSDVDGRAIARCRDELEQGEYHPLEYESTSGFLKRVVVQLSPRGEFLGDSAPRGETEHPTIGRDPVVFLRARTLGFAVAIEANLEDLQRRTDLPWSLLNVVGVEPPPTEDKDEEQRTSISSIDSEGILLSKPANPEQRRIAEQLERHGGVLVQGPPGTGKTHTIANLIGHLLAQGKSVLVTSHTTKALRMVRHHVVPQLQPLCVSVLERDLDSRTQLESSVGAISERLSASDAGHLEAEADKLAKQRRELRARLREAYQQLFDARADEYRDVVVGGQSWSPSEAARNVTREKGQNDWIPAPITLGAVMPLSEGELIELYRTNVTVSSEDESELSGILPDLNTILTPDEFEGLDKERERLASLDRSFRSDLWDSSSTNQSPEELELLADNLLKAIEPVKGREPWKLAAVAAGRSGGPHREPWEQLLSMIETLHREAAHAQETMLHYAPTLSDQMPLVEQAQIVDEILKHLESGGSLGLFVLLWHPRWKRLIRETRVASGEPRTVEDFRAIRTFVRLQALRKQLAERWDRQVHSLGAPPSRELGKELEKALIQFAPVIRECLNWHETTWEPVEKRLKNSGLRWDTFLAEQPPNLAPSGELLRLRDAITKTLQPIISSRTSARRWQRLEAQLADLRGKLAVAGGSHASSQVIARLREAVKTLDLESYSGAFERLVELHSRRSDLENRRKLLARLEPVAPNWAAAIRDRLGPHGGREIPGDPAAAWLWRQLHDELERRAKVSIEDLQQTIKRLSQELQRITAELIDRRAWAAQVRRTTLSQRQALIGWLDTVRKMGKGYGRRVPRLRVEAARKMSECRTAVPVWIMPLSRVVENFDSRTSRFDVVIIDEASQSDVMALLAFYLARKVVVVGDHEQVSPSAVGQDLAVVQHLIDEYLQGIPNNQLYDGKLSVYDLARQSFGGTICLLEHFRCVPDVIQFSNLLSYDGRIKPLRDPSCVQLRPHVVPHRVNAHSREAKVNPDEAITIVSLLIAAIEQPEYAKNQEGEPATFGVISLVGDDQAFEIDHLLQRFLPPEEYKRRRIVCGTAAQFQGDERDVMFLSVLDSPRSGPLPFRDQQMFKQRFNVAASRARDQMWVVHSLNPQIDLKPGDLRRRLIEHAEDPQALVRLLAQKEKRAESELERLVMRRLVSAGYHVAPQWMVGSYRIDMVVEGGGKRLAVECDGDRYHPLEKLQEDMERQAILERLGWTFVRIRGSVFFRDPDRAMASVLARLSSLEIPPEGSQLEGEKEQGQRNELLERLIRRAEELRRDWTNLDPGEAAAMGERDSVGTDPPRDTTGPQVISPDEAPTKAGGGKLAARHPDSHPDSRGTPVATVEEKPETVRSRSIFRDAAMDKLDNWVALLRWGRAKRSLDPYDQNFCIRIKKCILDGLELTPNQRKHAIDLWTVALDKGFRPLT